MKKILFSLTIIAVCCSACATPFPQNKLIYTDLDEIIKSTMANAILQSDVLKENNDNCTNIK